MAICFSIVFYVFLFDAFSFFFSLRRSSEELSGIRGAGRKSPALQGPTIAFPASPLIAKPTCSQQGFLTSGVFGTVFFV